MVIPLFLVLNSAMSVDSPDGVKKIRLKRFIPVDEIKEFNCFEDRSCGQLKLKGGQILELSLEEVTNVLSFLEKNTICSDDSFLKHPPKQ